MCTCAACGVNGDIDFDPGPEGRGVGPGGGIGLLLIQGSEKKTVIFVGTLAVSRVSI
jgi:hypothetical protein